MSNSSYYETENGRLLLHKCNYPEKIKTYLENERLLICSIARNYNGIIEMGCIDGRNLNVAEELQINYHGIDCSLINILSGKKQITCAKYNNSVLIHMEAFQFLSSQNISFFKNKLLIFPFNSLGNMNTINKILQIIAKLKINTLISTYKNNAETLDTRRIYYKICKSNNLKIVKNTKGVCFKNEEGLNAWSLSSAWLEQKFRNTNSNISFHELPNIGLGVYLLFDDSIN